ncbi:hypothetical protein [Xanthobacter sediminis]|uniref:hypothetical protein n=1 Tax=Xanthobacter sediminis TaxID=3119926 RepID=UPI003729903B
MIEARFMMHVPVQAARACALAALLAALAAATSARAQLQILDLNDLPRQRTLTPMNRLLPIDPHVVIRAYLAKNLPSLWWGREADFGNGRTALEIHIPDGWQGNPTTAMMRLCPQTNDNLWRTFREIELRPFFQKKFWPSWTCRL